MKLPGAIAFGKARDDGFTLTDLLAIIVIFGILGAMLLPALAGTKSNSAAFQCLQNQRQLVRAWQMYAEDNAGGLVASDGSSVTFSYNGRPVWVTNNMQFHPGNWNISTAVVNSPLWNYAGRTAVIFKCPSDSTMILIAGVAYPRVPSYNMSSVFGYGLALTPDNWRTYAKTADIVKPANTFVFIDEKWLYLNGGSFATQCNGLPGSGTSGPQIIDFPTINHNKAASLSFADGHAEMHQWRGNIILNASGGGSVSTSGDLADFIYLAENTTVEK